MEITQAFAIAFREARKAKNFTQEDFNESAGRTYISTLERAKFNPTLKKIDQLAQELSLHPLTLIFNAYLKCDSKATFESLMREITEDRNLLES